MTEVATATRTIVVERVMPHPPEKIWRALTQAPLIEEWLMKNDFQPVVGHRFNFRTTPMPQWNGMTDRFLGHLGQRGLAPCVVWTVILVFHMRAFEQAEQEAGRRWIRCVEACLLMHKLGAGATRAHPLGGQVAAILATTHVGAAAFRIDQGVRLKIGTTPAQGNFQAVPDLIG